MTAAPPAPSRRRSVRALVVFVVAAVDLGSKAWAVDHLSGARPGTPPPVCQPDADGLLRSQRLPTDSVTLIDGWLQLRYAENCGAAFSLFAGLAPPLRKTVFYLAAVLAMVVLGALFVLGRGGRAFAVSAPLILAGAIGNLVDRIQLGYVVDFIRFYVRDGFWFIPPGWEYPTFNIADAWITIGVALILIDALLEGRRVRQASAGTETPSHADA